MTKTANADTLVVMRHATVTIGLLAGLLLLDLFLNAAAVDPRAAVVTLLRPSIDLLVIGALLLGAAQAGAGGPGRSGGANISHRIIRGIVCLYVVGIAVHILARRFGLSTVVTLIGAGGAALAAGWALLVLGAAAVAVLAWIASGLVTRGFSAVLARSIFLLVLALLAVIHVLTGNRVFSSSEIPRIVREITVIFRQG